MKKIFILSLHFFIALVAMAQPEPFPIDKSFVPELDYLQKQWYGEYNGVDPMSEARISVKRTLCLFKDMTFTNLTYGVIRTKANTSEEMLLRKEEGKYQYNTNSREVEYVLVADSALDMNSYMRQNSIKYTVNKYNESSTNNSYSEPVQFTHETQGARNWVVLDSKLGSDRQQGMPAVYIMSGRELNTNVPELPFISFEKDVMYDLNGRVIVDEPNRGIIIKNGKKYIVK